MWIKLVSSKNEITKTGIFIQKERFEISGVFTDRSSRTQMFCLFKTFLVFSCKYWEILRNNFFYKIPPLASVILKKLLLRFSFCRTKPEPCNIWQQETLKYFLFSNITKSRVFFVKWKSFKEPRRPCNYFPPLRFRPPWQVFIRDRSPFSNPLWSLILKFLAK